jgi:Rrf2 family protein
MHYSVGVEYGLHCLVYLIDLPEDSTIGIKELAAFQGVSETYLSKIFGKLAKAGIVRSVPGVKGGYRLAKPPAEISFWDVVEAVEGARPIFQCKNVKDQCLLYKDDQYAGCALSYCTINLTMIEAEERMRDYLRGKTLAWLNEELRRDLPEQIRAATKAYFDAAR